MGEIERLPVGAKALDELLGGGLETECMTMVYGEAGTGKTNICLQVARNAARSGKKVLYIDTEGVSTERLKQISGKDFEKVLGNILFFKPESLIEQDERVTEVANLVIKSKNKFGLIILDSATLYYRAEFGMDNDVNQRDILYREATKLQNLAKRANIPVLITAQVYMDPDANLLRPLGGFILTSISRTIIFLEKVGSGKRKAEIVKHRSVAEHGEANFTIVASGLE
jgi:DNA repair protein RadB